MPWGLGSAATLATYEFSKADASIFEKLFLEVGLMDTGQSKQSLIGLDPHVLNDVQTVHE